MVVAEFLISLANDNGLPMMALRRHNTLIFMIHAVFFWLKADLTAEQKQTFETELLALPKLDYIAQGFVGTPAPTAHRPVTDHSFSYSLTLHFKTLEDHDYYQADCPAHKRFVDTCKTFWDRVVIYDSSPVS